MRTQPAPLISGFAAICVLLHLGLWLTGTQIEAIVGAGFIPARFSGAVAAPDLWMLPAWITPISSAFLHGGFVHLIFNMVILVFLGRQLEAPLGPQPMAVVLLVGALGGAAGQYLANPMDTTPMIGASGAISALIAVYALIFSQSQTKAIGPIPGHIVRALWLAAAWIGLQLLIGFGGSGGFGGIAIWAHVGGFLAGLILARPLLRWRFRHPN